jgi:hypothetical protein
MNLVWADFVGANRDDVAFLSSARTESGCILTIKSAMRPGKPDSIMHIGAVSMKAMERFIDGEGVKTI